MKRMISMSSHLARITPLAVIVGLVMSAPIQAQEAPKGNKGFKTLKSEIVELGPEIAGMEGRVLRLRLLSIEPQGYIGVHSHKDRPAVVYFLKGQDTVTFGDGSSKIFMPGDTGSANQNTTHWHRNTGTETVHFVAVDILNKKK